MNFNIMHFCLKFALNTSCVSINFIIMARQVENLGLTCMNWEPLGLLILLYMETYPHTLSEDHLRPIDEVMEISRSKGFNIV